MRTLIAAHALCALTLLASACGAQTADSNSTAARNSNAAAAGGSKASAHPSVASSHGGGDAAATSPNANAGAGANASAQAAERALVDTKAIDEKIEKALKRAKAAGASESDRAAAAAAYLERANVYYSAGNPRVYKYALADFKSVLVYEPSNAEAKIKRDQIIDIYINSLHRPVPEISNEQ